MGTATIQDSFRTVYDRYYQQAYFSAYAIVKDPYLAQDVAQETFLKVFQHFQHMREEGNQRAWIKAIARNKAIDFYRKTHSTREISVADDLFSDGKLDDGVEGFVEREAIRELLGSIDPHLSRSLLLVYLQGLSYEQLASRQNTTVGAVKSKLHRAKRLLRAAREKEGTRHP